MKVMNFINHFRTLQTRLISLLIFHFTSINDVLFTYSCIVENLVEFNISWLRGCHPLLNVGNLSIEASEKLGLLLDQLRSPTVKSLSSLVVVVLINRYVVYPSCILKHVQFFWLGKYLSSIFFITIYFFNTSFQSFSNSEEKTSILWTHFASFTWSGSSNLCHRRDAYFWSTTCSKKCPPCLLEMYTSGCFTGISFTLNILILLCEWVRILFKLLHQVCVFLLRESILLWR